MGSEVSNENHSQDHSTHSEDSSTHYNYSSKDDHSQWTDNSTHDDHSMRGNNNVNMSGASGISGHININSRINTRSAVGLAGPEVSNTAGGAVRIYYSNDEMRRVDILSKGVGGGEQKFTGSVPYMTIPADETVSVPPVKITYVSVYLESSSGDCKKVIVENYKVPENKSFVVTPDAIDEEEV